MMYRLRPLLIGLFFFLAFLPLLPAKALDRFTYFAQIPILAEGRIKPLDTFARVTLTTFYGKSSLEDMEAIEWLAEVLFDQKSAYLRPVFKIRNPDVLKALDLEVVPTQTYSYLTVYTAISKIAPLMEAILAKHDEAERAPTQKQLLELYFNVTTYRDLSGSLTIIKRLDSPGALNDLTQDGESHVFRVVPPQFEKGPDHEWISPWQVLMMGHGTPQTATFLKLWSQLSAAYFSRSDAEFEGASRETYGFSLTMATGLVSPQKLKWEVRYNRYDFFVKACALYLLGLLVLCLGRLVWGGRMDKAALVALVLGAFPHLTGLIIRTYVLSRPPVSTLYESIIFVAFIAVFAALLIESRRRDGIGALIGTVIGVVLLLVSFSYASDGDSMGMLAAVLNNNFWLATHVITITIGYGLCFVAALLGHTYLSLGLFRHKLRDPARTLEDLGRSMLGVTLFALFFSVLGTILGGIWADQSWGRFWGWDPKENGALLICLWLLWAIHGKICGRFNQRSFAVVISLTSVVVVVAWFGVNLLNVGLHSYGFTESIATNILLFSLAEVLFVTLALLLSGRRT